MTHPFKPGDRVLVTETTIDPVRLTVERTVHSVTFDPDGINTTQGDWFSLDEYEVDHA